MIMVTDATPARRVRTVASTDGAFIFEAPTPWRARSRPTRRHGGGWIGMGASRLVVVKRWRSGCLSAVRRGL
jgi:hypothetical protein